VLSRPSRSRACSASLSNGIPESTGKKSLDKSSDAGIEDYKPASDDLKAAYTETVKKLTAAKAGGSGGGHAITITDFKEPDGPATEIEEEFERAKTRASQNLKEHGKQVLDSYQRILDQINKQTQKA